MLGLLYRLSWCCSLWREWRARRQRRCCFFRQRRSSLLRERGDLVLRERAGRDVRRSRCCCGRLCRLPKELRPGWLGRERRLPSRRRNCVRRVLARLLHRHLLVVLSDLGGCWRAPSLRRLLLRPDARGLLLRPGRRLLPLLLRLGILLLRPRSWLLRLLVVPRVPLLVGLHCSLYAVLEPVRGCSTTQ